MGKAFAVRIHKRTVLERNNLPIVRSQQPNFFAPSRAFDFGADSLPVKGRRSLSHKQNAYRNRKGADCQLRPPIHQKSALHRGRSVCDCVPHLRQPGSIVWAFSAARLTWMT
jgi:hypothetical protein